MKRVAVAVLACAVSACGDNLPGPPDAPPFDVLAALRALPGVTADEAPTQTAGVHYYVLHFTQPVDHAQPDGQTFQQEVSLLHRDLAAPMIAHTSGYWDYYLDTPVELTELLAGNQISIEHRFFGTSRPDPADWSKLTIEQMADDEHAIIAALRTIYPGKLVTTGGSKGGMTAVYHRRFFPADADGTVPYVAPLLFALPDPRFPPFLDTLGPAACRQAVRDAATEMLVHRRAAMVVQATSEAQAQGFAYTRVALGPAVESAIQSLEWSFWQYFGIGFCPSVPAVTATDAAMWAFLDEISPVSDNDDAQVANFEAYVFQAYVQLGYPDVGAAYLTPFLQYTAADYAQSFPAGTTTVYDGGVAMHDIDNFVEQQGDGLIFVYGQWDPWSGGEFTLGGATDSLRLVEAQGTHDSNLGGLASGDRQAAFAELQAWTGVDAAAHAVRRVREPHVPPAMHQAVRLSPR